MKQSFLKAKDLQLAIKRGLTPELLAEEHGITVDELKAQIRLIYKAGDGSRAQSIYGQLEANRKKAHCRGRKSKEKLVPVHVTGNKVDTVLHVDSESEPEGPEVTVSEPKSQDPTLEELRRDEATLSEEKMAYESQREQLRNQLREEYKKMRSLQNKMDCIKKELSECYSEYDYTSTQVDSIMHDMHEIGKLQKEKSEALERVRQIISEKTAITMYVYNDGTIETPDNPDFVVCDEGFESLKGYFSEREECQDLRVRDITTLARLIKICEKVTERIILVCDNPELEKAILAIRQSD